MPESAWLLLPVVAAALLYGFANGWNDSVNAIATVVSTRVLGPYPAIGLAAAANMGGALTGTAVAVTIARELINPAGVTYGALLAALAAAIGWSLAMTWLRLPISASHALIGGLLGAALARGGAGMIIAAGTGRVLLWMLLSPLLGGLLGWALVKLFQLLFRHRSPETVNPWFRRLQLLSAFALSFAHGTADGQKVTGVILLALVAGGHASGFEVPLWAAAGAALALGLGTAFGGWWALRTSRMQVLRLQPVHGVAAEASAAGLLLATAAAGIPVSTTHSVTGAIVGVGVARRLRGVQWAVTRPILSAWVITLPGCLAAAWIFVQLLSLFA